VNARSLVFVFVMAGIGLTAVPVGAGSAGAAAAQDAPAARSVEVRGLRLRAGESVGFAYHPSVEPAELRVSKPGFEACPATTDGEIDLTGGSWPSASGFETCRPTDASGRVQVPSTTIPTFHVGFALRTRDGRAAKNVRISIDYEEVDGLFFYRPPPLRPGTRSAAIVDQSPSGPVAVVCMTTESGAPPMNVRVVLEQEGHRLRACPDEDEPEPDVVPGRPATARLRNVGARTERVGLFVGFQESYEIP
jgi:hypothetical protein